MSKQEEKSTKTKVKAFAYKTVSKIGHMVRKAGPYILTVGAAIGLNKLRNNHNNSKGA